jgi:phenylacetate-CoA ligase
MIVSAPTSRADLRTAQLSQLRGLLGQLRATNAWHGPRLAAAGLDEHLSCIEHFVERCPLTSKHELAADQEARPPFGSNLTWPVERYTRYHQTSGTTGAPLRWIDDHDSWQWMVRNWARVYRAAEVHPADRVYFAFSYGPFLGFWLAFEAAAVVGCLCLPGGGLSSAARLRMMIDTGATVLACTPTYALRLAEVAAQENIRLSDSAVRMLMVAGEPGGCLPEVRQRLTLAWNGARIVDHHGMTEVGPVSYQLPQEPTDLRVIESGYVAEVVDPKSGDPLPPGSLGELVLTTLGRVGRPLLRYRTGDLVRLQTFDEPRHGSIDAALVGGLLGRCDDMVLIRGVNVYPAAVDRIVRARPGVAEYRVDIDSRGAMAEMSLLVEPRGDADPRALADHLETDLRTALNLRVPVRLAEPGSLPRFEMKANRWVKHA